MFVHSMRESTQREDQFEKMMSELLPEVRSLNPALSAEEAMEAAVCLSASRLSDSSFVWGDA